MGGLPVQARPMGITMRLSAKVLKEEFVASLTWWATAHCLMRRTSTGARGSMPTMYPSAALLKHAPLLATLISHGIPAGAPEQPLRTCRKDLRMICRSSLQAIDLAPPDIANLSTNHIASPWSVQCTFCSAELAAHLDQKMSWVVSMHVNIRLWFRTYLTLRVLLATAPSALHICTAGGS